MDGSKRAYAPFSVRPAWFLALLLIASSVIAASASAAIAKERRAEVTYSVDLNAPADAKHARLWLPYPMSDENQKITLEQAKPLREYYFGAVDESRIAIGTGRDLILTPPQSGEPLNYFMYPYAEADGKPLNEDLYGFNLGYKITFREL